MDIVIVAIAVIIAAGYLIRRIMRAVKAKDASCDCGGCNACSAEPNAFSGKEEPDKKDR